MAATLQPTTKTWTLSIEGLCKSYSDNVLFQNLDLEIRPGMAIRVQGPNGSGKTQLMLVIAGLVEPDAGLIRFCNGQELLLNPLDADVRARFLRYVPYLPSGLSEMPLDRALLVMTGRLRAFSLASQRKAAAKVLAELEAELRRITPDSMQLYRPLANYSIGQQKRLALAASLCVPPYPILAMIDEPLAGLDANGIERVLYLLSEARDRGMALLISEHRPEISGLDFDGHIRLPYRPNSDPSPAASQPSRPIRDSCRPRPTKAILQLNNVEAGYLDHLVYCPALTVMAGGLVVIQGPNASGKTGFVRALFRYTGTRIFGELEFEGLPALDLRLGQEHNAVRYLSQTRELFPDLTVQESITVAGNGRRSELAGEIAEIERFLGPRKFVRHLSSGGRALLGLAQALAGAPRLLVLDEPAANTDAENRRLVWDIILRVCRYGRTAVLVIEHDSIPIPASAIYEIQQQERGRVLTRIV